MSKQPVRLILKNGDYYLTTPKKKDIVTNIHLEDLKGSNELIKTLKDIATTSPTKAIQFLLLYKYLYDLSDDDVRRYSTLANIGKPINSYKLELIKNGVCSKTFPTFFHYNTDDTDLTKTNWITFKMNTLVDYLYNSIKSSQSSVLNSLIKETSVRDIKEQLKTLLHITSFDRNAELTNFTRFYCISNITQNQFLILNVNSGLLTLEARNTEIPNGLTIGKAIENRSTPSNLVSLEGGYPNLVKYIDYCLNTCMEKYLEKQKIII